MLYDAHNHIHDARLEPWRARIDAETNSTMVVNGTSESDWLAVLDRASKNPRAIASLGLHPWRVETRSPRWLATLNSLVRQHHCGVGEFGLDRWMRNPDLAAQEEVFLAQLDLAAKLNRPASIHCLKAWGRLYDLLRANPRPECGFLLHSYGGPAEMIKPFADLGAYFSISGYFAHDRKARQREVFLRVPLARLLIETDAPDMPPPPEFNGFDRGALNHPANIENVYRWVSTLLPKADLPAVIETNFHRLFGGLIEQKIHRAGRRGESERARDK